jgi:hypothetical protein
VELCNLIIAQEPEPEPESAPRGVSWTRIGEALGV